MSRALAQSCLWWVSLFVVPSVAFAQSAITGVVKDATGAVLVGVTVEAASGALIERARSAVTDAQGVYRIVDLRPGTYTVTFALAGFSTSKRDGIELPAEFTATVNGELAVGAVEETVTVDRTFSISAGLAASTVTPGRTAPDASRTTPVTLLCAHAEAERRRNDAAIRRHGIRRISITPLLLVVLISEFARHPSPAVLIRSTVADQRLPSGVSGPGRPPASRARICAPFTTFMTP